MVKLPPVAPKKVVRIEYKEDENKDRQSYIKPLYQFVREGEGAFQAKAFCDSYQKVEGILIRHTYSQCKKWTIGYGTNSFPGEAITIDEAIKRKEGAIDFRDAKIKTTCLSNKARIIAVDFIYQYSSKYANQMLAYANSCDENSVLNYIVNHRDFYKSKGWRGLAKREQKRINFYYN